MWLMKCCSTGESKIKRSLSSRIREYFDTNRENVYEIRPYLVKDGKEHPVAIICPGGGYRRVCNFIEGHPYAKKLNAMGYHAIVVFYRVNVLARYPAPQEDLARAVKTAYAKAEEWKLDMKGYSVWGSSAGGHLAASFGTKNMGYTQYGLPKPGALILTYPVVTMGEKAHEGSRTYLLGKNPTEGMFALPALNIRWIPITHPHSFGGVTVIPVWIRTTAGCCALLWKPTTFPACAWNMPVWIMASASEKVFPVKAGLKKPLPSGNSRDNKTPCDENRTAFCCFL